MAITDAPMTWAVKVRPAATVNPGMKLVDLL
jgi:hypothetical protein